jgi:hypothetical protein
MPTWCSREGSNNRIICNPSVEDAKVAGWDLSKQSCASLWRPRLDEVVKEPWALPVCVERIREMYTVRIQRFQVRVHHDGLRQYEETS